MRGKISGFVLVAVFAGLVMQCDFGLPSRIVMPTWQITLTIPLVSENYPFDGLLNSDTTGTIRVYGDSVDTNSDGTMDILLPDTLADYPGGLYITLSNDLPPITLPENMFVIPGQDPMELGVDPIDIGSMLPDELTEGINFGPVDSIISIADLGINLPSKTFPVPNATCEVPDSIREDTISFTFGNDPSDINAADTVYIPGYTRIVTGYLPSTDPDTSLACTSCPGGIEVPGICEISDTLEYTDYLMIPGTALPTIRQAFGLLPEPSVLPSGTPLRGFESVTIATGEINSVINSRLPLTLTDAGFVVYTKKANGDTIQLHNHFYDKIYPYMDINVNINLEDSVRRSSLDDVVLYDSLIFEFGGTIQSSTSDILMFPAGETPFFHYEFSVAIDSFKSINVIMADTSMFFQQGMNTSSSDPSSGQNFSVEIVSATFTDEIPDVQDDPDTNFLAITINNQMGIDIDSLRIKLINFYENQQAKNLGNYKILRFSLPKDSTKGDTLILDGHVIANTLGGEIPIDSLMFITEIEFSSDGSAVEIPFPLPDEMSMDVAVDMKPLKINDLTGFFGISFEISEQEQPLSLPGLVGGISFGEAILDITLANEFGVAPGLGLDIKGYRGLDSVVVSINPDSVTFEPGSPSEPVSTSIRVSRDYVRKTVNGITEIVQHYDSGNNIVDLMGLMPDRISVGGDAKISPAGLSSITAGAEVSGTWHFEIPFLLSVTGGGVEFLPPTFTLMSALDSSAIENLVGSDGVPDKNDLLISSKINTIIFSDIGLAFGMEILVSDLPYFPFYNTQDKSVMVSADLDLDGTADTVDLNLDTLIIHPVIATLELQVPGGTVDPATGLVIPGMEGSGSYEYSADFNVTDTKGDTTIGTFVHHQHAFLDTFMLARSDTGAFSDVDQALLDAGIDAPTVADSLYHLTLSKDGTELWLLYDVSPYGELGWLIEDKDHYIATKFILRETPNPALLSYAAGIDVTAFMEFILNSAPIFGSAEEEEAP